MRKLIVAGAAVEYRQAGRGADLVLLHSLLTDMAAFTPIEHALASRYRLTLLNLPGYGGSSGIAADTVEDYADHVVAVLDGLALPPSIHLFGNGFGAFVAAALAARHSGRIGCLILADALVSFPVAAKGPLRAMAQSVERDGMGAVLDVAIARMFPPEFAAARPGVVAERKAALSNADAAAFARACRALALLDLAPVLGAIRNPTLVAVGEMDATTPPSLAAELAGGIRGSVFHTIPGCGHCPMVETPAELIALINEFLTRA